MAGGLKFLDKGSFIHCGFCSTSHVYINSYLPLLHLLWLAILYFGVHVIVSISYNHNGSFRLIYWYSHGVELSSSYISCAPSLS